MYCNVIIAGIPLYVYHFITFCYIRFIIWVEVAGKAKDSKYMGRSKEQTG